MATRNVYLRCLGYSTAGNVSAVVNFNNIEVFNGEVPTLNEASPAKGVSANTHDVAIGTVDTSLTGNVALSIAVTGGSLHFVELNGNYTGCNLLDTDGDGTPDIVANAYVVLTPPETYMNGLCTPTVASDGKSNVAFSNLTGDTPTRSGVDSNSSGPWVYIIEDGVTFSCDYNISNTLISVPTPGDGTALTEANLIYLWDDGTGVDSNQLPQ